jgi:3D (Asp-Asp-Asp) domain-containing protein/peptidoglycan hydrolase CwlO-like protein
MKRALVIAAVTWLLGAGALIAAGPAGAAPTAETRLAADESARARSLAQQRDRAVLDLLVLDRRLASGKAGLEQAQADLDQTASDLARRTREVEQASRDLTLTQGRLATRVRQSYVRGPFAWLDLLTGTRSVSALVSRVDLVNRILGQDAKMAKDVKTARSRAEGARQKLQALERSQKDKVVRLAERKVELQQARRDQASVVAGLGDRLAAAQAAARAAEAKMVAINDAARSAGGASGGSSPAAITSARGGARDTGTTPTTHKSAGSSGGSSSGPPKAGQSFRAKVTAYSDGGYAASGVPCGPGVVATDPRVIPMGTRLYIPGWGYGIAADTGGDIKNNWIDVWLPSEQQASDWGVQYITITILG